MVYITYTSSIHLSAACPVQGYGGGAYLVYFICKFKECTTQLRKHSQNYFVKLLCEKAQCCQKKIHNAA